MQPFFHIFLRPLSYMNYNARSGVGNWQSRTIQCTILGVQKRKEASRTDLHSQPLSDLLFFYDTHMFKMWLLFLLTVGLKKKSWS